MRYCFVILLLFLTSFSLIATGGCSSESKPATNQNEKSSETATASETDDTTSTAPKASALADVVDAGKPFDQETKGDEWLTGDWKLEWSDEFEVAGQPNPEQWHFFTPEKPQRNETAYLTDDHAYCQDGRLVMEAVVKNGRAEMSQLRSYDNMSPGWDRGFPHPEDLLLDPTKGPLYLETSVRFDQAASSYRAWWSFWLLSPNADWLKDADGNPNDYAYYDGNPDTGTEVDIFEYVPDVTKNGFNIAIFKSKEGDNKSIRPDDKMFTTQNAQRDFGVTLDDGKYHKLGFYYSVDRYAFYLDNKLIWTFSDTEKPGWITKLPKNGILLTWEADNLGPWGQEMKKNADGSFKTFVSEKTDARVLIDYVRIHRKKTE